MSEREDNVYKAKLAEQAERYDGMYIFFYFRPYFVRYLQKLEQIQWMTNAVNVIF